MKILYNVNGYYHFLVEELGDLIKFATENGLLFVYAISPGLDITYSDEEEIELLRRKLLSVSTFAQNKFLYNLFYLDRLVPCRRIFNNQGSDSSVY